MQEKEHNLPGVIPSYASKVDPNDGTTLEFVPMFEINGTKCTKLVPEDIEGEIVYWQNTVMCCVLGANPPFEVIERYGRRV